MKIYTKTGDAGETGLFGGPRVRKDDARIEAYGTVDELNSAVGLARCEALPEAVALTLERVQSELFAVGAELATPDPTRYGTLRVGSDQVAALERAIDELEAGLPPLRNFILPAGSRGAAHLHAARGICRRAERRVVSFAAAGSGDAAYGVVQYLNRLGDYLFVAARYANAEAGVAEVPWRSS